MKKGGKIHGESKAKELFLSQGNTVDEIGRRITSGHAVCRKFDKSGSIVIRKVFLEVIDASVTAKVWMSPNVRAGGDAMSKGDTTNAVDKNTVSSIKDKSEHRFIGVLTCSSGTVSREGPVIIAIQVNRMPWCDNKTTRREHTHITTCSCVHAGNDGCCRFCLGSSAQYIAFPYFRHALAASISQCNRATTCKAAHPGIHEA